MKTSRGRSKRKDAPLEPLYERTRLPAPAGDLDEAFEWLRVKPGELRDALDLLEGYSRWLVSRHPDGPIATEAAELLREVRFAQGMRGEARDLHFIRVGMAVGRMEAQGSEVARQFSAKLAADRVNNSKARKAGKASAAARRKTSAAIMTKEIVGAAAKERARGTPERRIASRVAQRVRATPKHVREVIRRNKANLNIR